MADSYSDKIQKLLPLDIKGIPKDKVVEAKNAVGQYLLDEILTNVGRGVSPVAGQGSFDKLSDAYADKEKGGDTLANLELDGDMLGSLDFKRVDQGIVIGIMDESQRPKADGHNHFKAYGTSKLPKRRFIPMPSEKFLPDIMKEVGNILNEYRTQEPTVGANTSDIQITERKKTSPLSITLGDILSNDNFVSELLRRSNGK